MKKSKICKKGSLVTIVAMLLMAGTFVPATLGGKFENELETINDTDKEYIVAIGPASYNKFNQYDIVDTISEKDAIELKNIIYDQGENKKYSENKSTEKIISILKKMYIYPEIEMLSEFMMCFSDYIDQEKNIEMNSSQKSVLDENYPPSHLCVGPHIFLYASPFSSIFAYNIQGINLFHSINRIEDLLNITKEDNPLLHTLLNVYTRNMSILKYADIKSAMIVIGGSLGRYWSINLIDTAFGDMTFKITGPFVGMFTLVADFGIYIFEDPKDGESVEKPWLDMVIGISMFSMQIQTIVDFNPTQ